MHDILDDREHGPAPAADDDAIPCREGAGGRDIVGAWLLCLFLAAAAVLYPLFGAARDELVAAARARLPAVFCAQRPRSVTAHVAMLQQTPPVD